MPEGRRTFRQRGIRALRPSVFVVEPAERCSETADSENLLWQPTSHEMEYTAGTTPSLRDVLKVCGALVSSLPTTTRFGMGLVILPGH